MNWNQQTVLVTGAGGFIGSHLTERLVALGADTRAFVHYNSANSWGWLDSSTSKDNFEVFQGDIRDPASLKKAVAGADLIFHLAALITIPYSYTAPLSYVQTNVEGTLNILQAALDEGVSILVHTSTSEVYGTALSVPIHEDHRLQGQSPYSASKIGADKLVEAFHSSWGLPVVTVRPFNTFGPRQSARAVIPTIVTQALTGSAIHLGTLDSTRDFNFVEDTVEGFIKAAESPQAIGQVINIGSGTETSVGELTELIINLIGNDVPVLHDEARIRPNASEVWRLCADNRRAKETLGWQPQHTLEDGLIKTVDWIRENQGRYRSGVYSI